MKLFLSRFINKVDKKRRVSVPTEYRNIIGQGVLILYPSFKNECVEACSYSTLQDTWKVIEQLDPYSDERDAFEVSVLSESVSVSFDTEGRVVIPKNLCEHAEINDNICFVGKGKVFEIWNPEKFDKHLALAKQKAKENRLLLKNI